VEDGNSIRERGRQCSAAVPEPSPAPVHFVNQGVLSMLSGEQVASLFSELGVTHVVTVPDSTIGKWGDAIARTGIRLVRVCREGEAWAVAGGLHLGGARPLVLIQCTGLFESGDSLRNIVHDWKLPIFSVIGYRSYLNQDTLPGDTCLAFTEPVLDAWKIDWKLVTKPEQIDVIREHYTACRAAQRAGAVVVAEGKA
jgi:sulfopyruvate decarboxylase TPP-binding subunit